MIKKHRETLDDLLAPHCSEGLRRGVDFVYAHTWTIPRVKALDLIEEIEAEQNKCQGLVSFNLLGNEAILTKLRNGGHNCYTWTCEKLRHLNIPEVNEKIKSKMWDKIVCKPSGHINKHPDEPIENSNSVNIVNS